MGLPNAAPVIADLGSSRKLITPVATAIDVQGGHHITSAGLRLTDLRGAFDQSTADQLLSKSERREAPSSLSPDVEPDL